MATAIQACVYILEACIGMQATWMDASEGQADASRGQMNAPSMLNSVETARMSNVDSASMYLGAGDAKHGMVKMDGIESHTDVSSGHRGVPSIGTDTT